MFDKVYVILSCLLLVSCQHPFQKSEYQSQYTKQTINEEKWNRNFKNSLIEMDKQRTLFLKIHKAKNKDKERIYKELVKYRLIPKNQELDYALRGKLRHYDFRVSLVELLKKMKFLDKHYNFY